MKDKNGVIGFVLLGLLIMAYFWVGGDPGTGEVVEEDGRDSLSQTEQAELDTGQMVIDEETALLPGQDQDSIQDIKAFVRFGDFANSSKGEEKEFKLENDLAVFTFTNKGARIKEVEVKDYKKLNWDEDKKVVESKLLLLEDEKNRFEYLLPVNGVATPVSTADLVFDAVEVKGDRIVFRAYAGAKDKYFEQSYSLNEDYILDYDISFKGLENVLAAGTDKISLNWINYLDKIERASDYAKNYTTVYFKQDQKNSPSYCGCRGDDMQNKDKPMKWISHSNQFFNTTLLADKAFGGMVSETKMLEEDADDLKRLASVMTIPYTESGDFGMTIYSGPNEFDRLSAFNEDVEDIIPYGRSILGTINRWVIRPIFKFISSWVGNMGIVIIIVTLCIKLLLYPLSYKMLYSQAKMAALKPEIEEQKKKAGDDPKDQQMATMKLYRETGVNPLGGCLPMVLQMPIWIALYRYFPAAIEFRQAGFLWADDLASYDVFMWLPFEIPFYGAHMSLFTILWAISTVIYTYYNSKHMDMSANPAMKYMQYTMPLMFLFFFNSLAAGLTCYMFFSNLMNIVQTLLTKNVIINKEKVLAELAENKKKPKKEGGLQQRWTKALEDAQKAQEEREKTKKKKK